MTVIKMSEVCACPFCPMVKANLQVCDVIITESKESWNIRKTGEPMGDLGDAVILLVRFAKQEHLPVGYSRCFDKSGEYTCNLYRTKRNEYKFCFHVIAKN